MKLRTIVGVSLFWLVGSLAPLQAAESYPESVGVGVLDEVDPAAGTMVIEGYRYRIASGIPVQIGGSGGSIDGLTPGMQVQFRFIRIPNDLRELLEVREIPPGVTIERH